MTTPTNYTAPAQVSDLLTQAYRLLEDAQAHANQWDRLELGRGLDNIRWQLGDFIAQMTPLTTAHTLDPVTGEWVADTRHAFSLALEGGE
jgi:hypothetical protein